MADETTVTDETDDEGPRPATRLSRRQLLRTGVNLGFAGSLVWTAGTHLVPAGEAGTITYALARPRPGADRLEPRTKDVPVAWHRSYRLAVEAHRRLREAGLGKLVDSFVVPGTLDDPQATVSVRATETSLLETIEDLASDVPIDFDVAGSVFPKPYGEFDLSETYRTDGIEDGRVPGGVLCEAGGSYATVTPALYAAESGARYFATSNHAYGASGTKVREHHGDPLSIPVGDRSLHVGDVVRGYPAADVVTVEPVEGYRPTSVIERASPSRVIGQYTEVGLADLMAREEPLTKLGATSDRTTGLVKGVDGMTCYTGRICKTGQHRWGGMDDFTDGDSGSVSFHPDPEHPDDHVLVGGITNARLRVPVVDYAWGTAAHHLLDRYGFHF
ncbi:hypothetical protein ACKVMT_12275 [Halobacteriales archaeon Cl-PHB]